MKFKDFVPGGQQSNPPPDILQLQQGIVYGPIQSRRLGVSLGLNVLSTQQKICSFDCVYCQYGWTDLKTHDCPEPAPMKMPTCESVLKATEAALTKMKSDGNLPDHITFAGNGEPTLHPDFPSIVAGVRAISTDIAPDVKLSILSNSSRAHEPSIRAALREIDFRYMKFDCGSLALFQRYNRPHNPIGLHLIIEGLRNLASESDVVLQSLFCGGAAGNLIEENIDEWLSHVSVIRPKEVQVYSLDRGFPESELEKATPAELKNIAARLKVNGINTAIF